jgi:hypothetical protein
MSFIEPFHHSLPERRDLGQPHFGAATKDEGPADPG